MTMAATLPKPTTDEAFVLVRADDLRGIRDRLDRIEALLAQPEPLPLPVTLSIAPDAYGTPALLLSCPRDDDERPIEARILEQLHMGPKTKNTLRNVLGRSNKHVEDAITKLFEAQAIRKTTVQVRGRETAAFELRRDGANGAPKVAGLWPDSGGAK
jgi:hypothetical protein